MNNEQPIVVNKKDFPSKEEIAALKAVILAELLEKIQRAYGSRTFVLMNETQIQIVKADLQGFALLSSKTEFEVLHTFENARALVKWMSTVAYE